METSSVMTEKSVLISDVKERVQDIYLAISWRELKRDYFDNGKSMSWFQHKIYGIDGNGGVGGFTPQEIEQLRGPYMTCRTGFAEQQTNYHRLQSSRIKHKSRFF